MNTLVFSLAAGPNPVHGDFDPRLELPPGLDACELGLVVGPVLEDIDYITDYSGPSPDHPRARRYRGLADVLSVGALATWRARLVGLLESLLAPGESWYLFLSRELAPGIDPPAEVFAGRVLADDFALNGSFTIVEVPAGELEFYAVHFGDHDRIGGLVAPAGSLRAVLSCLSLAEALPTGQRYRFASPFHVRDTAALGRLFAHGRLFVEETDNGTRLRLITHESALAGLRARLTDLAIAEPA